MIVQLRKGLPVGTRGPDSEVRLRCPVCRHLATFDPVTSAEDVMLGGSKNYPTATYLGQRVCPNPDCRTHIFFVMRQDQVLASYPPELIDFDTTNIPEKIVSTLAEAIVCHANGCYTAAGMMVRKTLEEMCHERGATGHNLKARLEALSTLVVLQPELIEGMTELRFLGNDAAHVKSQEYDSIGKDEIELAIDITKRVLDALYQTASLLDRLRARKKQSS